jgi:magnesium transporter
VKEATEYTKREGVTWLNIDGVHSTSLMAEISEVLGLERMVLAEAMNTHTRPRFQEFDDCLFVSMKMLKIEGTKYIKADHLSLLFNERLLITFQEEKGVVFEPIRERIRKQRRRISHGGTDFLAFALLDVVIDNYIYVLGEFADEIEVIEDSLFKRPNQRTIIYIKQMKQKLNFIRRTVLPAKDMIITLNKSDTDYIDDTMNVHYKELEDNIRQATETSENFREILNDQLNLYNSTLNNRLNDTIRFLTVFSALFIPLTFIVGVYGTNFDNLPELHYRYGYYTMWGVMLLISVTMLLFFRRKKWL